MLTVSRCWWQILLGRINMLVNFSRAPKSLIAEVIGHERPKLIANINCLQHRHQKWFRVKFDCKNDHLSVNWAIQNDNDLIHFNLWFISIQLKHNMVPKDVTLSAFELFKTAALPSVLGRLGSKIKIHNFVSALLWDFCRRMIHTLKFMIQMKELNSYFKFS